MTQTISNGQTVVVNSVENTNYFIENGTLEVTSGGSVVGQYDNPLDPVAVFGSSPSAILEVSGGSILGPGGASETVGGTAVRGVQLTISDGSITGGQAATQAGAAVSASAATVEGGTVIGGEAITGGGAGFVDSEVSISAGSITGGHGGTVGGAAITGGTAIISGGHVIGGAADTSGGAAIQNARSVKITGGTVQAGSGGTTSGVAIDRGDVTITGGSVVGDVRAVDSLALSNAEVQGDIVFYTGTATIASGTVTGTIAFQGMARLVVQGGTFSSNMALIMTRGATATIQGGAFQGSWRLADRSSVTVYGTGLSFSNGQLSGTLADGSAIDIRVELGLDSHVFIHNT